MFIGLEQFLIYLLQKVFVDCDKNKDFLDKTEQYIGNILNLKILKVMIADFIFVQLLL